MINKSHINRESKWEYLPWQKINARVILIQKKIYEASKQCNTKLVHKAQYFLLNSHEAKLIAIENILNKISKYYYTYNLENYLIKDVEKFYLFKYLFTHNSLLKTKLKFLSEKIKEYLIYLCLEAEWKARIVPVINKYNKFIISKSIIWNLSIENLNWNRILYKKQLLPYIYHNILYWIKNKFFISDLYNSLQSLYHLLLKIYHIRIEWHQSILIKWKYQYMLMIKKSHEYKKHVFDLRITKLYENNISYYYRFISSQLINIIYILCHRQFFNKFQFHNSLSWYNILDKATKRLQIQICKTDKPLKYLAITNIIDTVNIFLSSLKNKKNYHNTIYLNFNKLNPYSVLYKKLISVFLYKYLFKINR